MVPVEILLNFGKYFRTLQLGFWKFLSGIVFLHHYVRTIGLFFSQAHSIWPKPRAFHPDRKSMGTPTFYCEFNQFSKYRKSGLKRWFKDLWLCLYKSESYLVMQVHCIRLLRLRIFPNLHKFYFKHVLSDFPKPNLGLKKLK